jgi:type II secretory pathway predicted ATPase ExeA
MYEVSFGLCKRPFAAAPRADCCFPAATIEAARQTLTRCIERAEGAGMVVGPSGTGKTLLCQVIAERFRDRLDVVFLSSGRLGNRRTLLQGILYGLKRPYREMDEGELRIALVDYLTGPGTPSKGMLLLADEAHTLPLRCLDELRMVTNLAVDGQPRTRLVLFGASLLEERLAHPKLDSFSQRLVARCYLEAMNRTETEAYVHAQFAAAGGNAVAVFPSQTCHAVYQAAGGVPRLVNQICDHALVLADAAGQKRIDPVRVQEAWADLQQLPTPWNGETAKERPVGEVIEFGVLDDEPGQPAGRAAPLAATEAASAATEAVPAATADVVSTEPDVACTSEPTEQIHEIQQMLGELEDDFRPAGTIGPEVELVLDDPGNPFSERFLEEEIVVDRHAAALAERNVEAMAAVVGTRTGVGSPAQPARIERETLPLRSVAAVVDLAPEEPELVIDEEYDFVEPVQTHPVTPVPPHEYRSLFARLRRA